MKEDALNSKLAARPSPDELVKKGVLARKFSTWREGIGLTGRQRRRILLRLKGLHWSTLACLPLFYTVNTMRVLCI
jgi:hypothetical protein